MKYIKFLTLLLAIFISLNMAYAQERKDMSKSSETIRLIYPQWQGANISKLVPELKPEDASKGYILGSYLLNYLAPETSNKTLEVLISEEIKRIESIERENAYKLVLRKGYSLDNTAELVTRLYKEE